MRIGGLVKPGSLQRGDNLQVSFAVTDGNADIAVRYQGIVPDLFREGQGVVAEGKLESGGVLAADTVLAKHDERYMPREVVDALKKSGRWQEGEAKSPGVYRDDPRARSLCLGAGVGLGAHSGHYTHCWCPWQRCRTDGARELDVADAVCFCRLGISGVDRLLRDLGFLGCDSLRKCTFDDAANLQGHKRLGKPRRLDALVGSDTVLFRGIGWRIRKQLACNTQSVLRIGSAIVDRLRFLLVHPLHFQPFLASGAGPFEGRDLNPILQDIGLAIHPPLLYLGYVGFSIAFSFAIAALIERRIDAAGLYMLAHRTGLTTNLDGVVSGSGIPWKMPR